MVSKIYPDWKNPYKVKRTVRSNTTGADRAHTKASDAKDKDSARSNPDILLMMNNFQEGIKGISSSIQQFEKTMESLTQLYQTIDKLGGFKRLNAFMSATPERNSNAPPNLNSLYNHLQTLLEMLQKVDFQQINQFLDSSIVQGIANEQPPKNNVQKTWRTQSF